MLARVIFEMMFPFSLTARKVSSIEINNALGRNKASQTPAAATISVRNVALALLVIILILNGAVSTFVQAQATLDPDTVFSTPFSPPVASPPATATPAGMPPAGAPTATPPAATPTVPPATPAASASQVTEQVSPQSLDLLKTRIDEATELTDAQKQQSNELIEKAKASLTQAAEHSGSLRTWQAKTESLDTERKTEQAKVDAAQRLEIQQPQPYSSLVQLEQTLASKQQELVKAETDLAQTEKSLTDRAARQKLIKERLAAIPAQIDQLKADLIRPDGAAASPLLAELRRQIMLADLSRLESEPSALQSEAAFLTAQEAANLLTLRRQGLVAVVARLKEEVTRWQDEVQKTKSSDARTRARLSRAEAESTRYPEMKKLYEENVKTVESEIEVREKRRELVEQITAIKAKQKQMRERLEGLQARESTLRSSTAFGIRLREQLRFVSNLNQLRQQIRDRAAVSEQAHVMLLEVRETRAETDHLNQRVEEIVSSILPPDATEELRKSVTNEAQDACEQRQKDVAELESACEAYVASLEQLDSEQSALIEQQIGFLNYINQRILWVPTHRLLSFEDIVHDAPNVKKLISSKVWSTYWEWLKSDAADFPVLYFAATLAWVILLGTQKIQREKIRASGQKASSRLNTAMGPTWSAVFWTTVKSLVAPMPLLFLGWRASLPGSGIENFGSAVYSISVWLWWLEAVRLVCRTGGLGPSHFQWPTRVNAIVSRSTSSFIGIATPLIFLLLLFRQLAVDGGSDAVRRCLDIAFLLLTSYTLHRLTSPKTGVFQEWIESHRGGWIDRLSVIWHAIAVALPIVFAGLCIAGYTYAVDRLSVRLAQTLIIVTGTIFVRALLFRGLTLRQRRLAIAHAREVRAALADSQGQEDSNTAAMLEAQAARANLADVSTQSKRLLATTMITLCLVWVWYIWMDVLPALQQLDQTRIPGIPLTLDKLLTAILQTILFTTAARNIPGLIEITLLERLPLDRSVRYATGAIIRYVIVVLGILKIGSSLGIQWQEAQWLVAALTFSLGFGLQEIFANFVSGLIILFEQPVRVGDVVTLDNVTGTINRIRIRSTSIVDWDRKEYIVPNKEFITGKLLNWTLTDTVNRILITIQTSRDTDPQKVRELVLKILTTQPHVLTEPGPNVVFDGFGESSLKFTISLFLPSLDLRTETVNSMHTRMHKIFQESGIDLAYPQRELSIRTIAPIDITSPPLTKAAEPSKNGDTAHDLEEAVD